MPNPVNLSLNLLKTATGAGTPSLVACNGGSGANIKISDFAVQSVGTPTISNATLAFGEVATMTLGFGGEGSRFSRIKTNTSNFTWTAANELTPITNSGHTRTWRNDYNPGGQSCSSQVSRSLTVKFNDGGFNSAATGNYNATLTVPVTLRSPPRPVINVVLLTSPPRPCVGGSFPTWQCVGGKIRINVDMGTYGGVSATSATIYRNNTVHTTITSNQDVEIGGLTAGTTHSIHVVNNYGCRDTNNLTSVTIPAYVYP